MFSQKLYFENYNVNNNLPSSQINTIFQDSYGFIWIGTAEGLRKFDGANFKEVYTLGNKEIGGNINSVVESRQFIYILSNKAVYKSFGNYFQEIRFYKADRPNFINGSLLIDSTLVILSDNGLWKLEDSTIVRYNTRSLVDYVNVRCAHYSKKTGLLWIGTESNGLIVFSVASQKIVTTTEVGLADVYKDKILNIAEDKHGTVYVSVADKGVYEVSRHNIRKLEPPPAIDLRHVTYMTGDHEGNLWLATLNAGLVCRDSIGYKKLDQKMGLNCGEFLSLLIDKENNTWIGSLKNGLFQLKKNQFVIYNSQHGLQSDNILSVKQSAADQVYVLTDKGLSVFEKGSFTPLDKLFAGTGPPSVLVRGPGKLMTAGTTRGYLVVMDKTGKLKQGRVFQDEVTALYFLSEDEVMAANSKGEIYVYDFIISEAVLLTKQLAGTHIYAIDRDAQHNIWVATSRGVYLLRQNQLQKQFEDNESLSLSEVYALEIRNNKVFMVPECCGVWMYDIDKGKTYFFDKSRGLSSNAARALYIQNDKETYITTNNMLNHVVFLDSTEIVKQYRGYTNLEYSEFSIGALQKTAGGDVLAGTNNGLLVYNEMQDSISRLSPKVVIEEIMLMNKPTNWARSYSTNFKTGLPRNLELKYDQNDITFEYIGIKFSSNEKLYYSYKLLGFQDDWVLTNETNKAIFSNLTDGDYEFLVRVSTNNVQWSQALSYKFKILPPFWKTKWFVILMLSIISLIVALVFRNQVTFSRELVRTNAADVPLKSARMIMLFACIIIPTSGFLYSLVTGDKGNVPQFHYLMGLVTFVAASLTYVSRYVKANISNFLLYSYIGVLLGYQVTVLFSNLHPYLVASIILAITAGSAIISRLRIYIFISIILVVSAFVVIYMVNKPLYNPFLFLFGIVSATAVSILILLVKLNLSEKLIFADSVINRGNSLVVAGNKKGEIIYVSENVKSILGYEKEEVLGDKWWSVTSDDEAEVKALTYAKRDLNAPYSRPVKEKNGGRKWIQWVDKKFDDDLLVGIGTDITLQKEYQDKFEYIVENANDIIYTTDRYGYFSYTNEVAHRITGYSRDELAAKNFKDLVDPAVKREIHQMYKQKEQERSRQFYLEFPILSKLGRKIWIGQSVRFLYDRNGMFAGTEAISRDITELMEAKNILDSNNQRLQMLNLAKEKILVSKSIEEVCVNVLETLGKYVHVSTLSSIHVNSKRKGISYAFTIDEKKRVRPISYPYVDLSFLDRYFPELLSKRELILDAEHLDVWRELFHYADSSLVSSLIVPIFSEGELLGLINFFAPMPNAYNSDDTWVLNDIAIGLSSFITAYEQKEIITARNIEIENYSRRLELLNYSKQRLMQAGELSGVYKELILLLKERLENVYRVSVGVFDIDKEIAHMFYLNTIVGNDTVENKLVNTHNIESMPTLLKGEIYYRPEFDVNEDSTADDRHWHRVGVRSVLYVPIKINGQVYGSVNLMSSRPNHFTQAYFDLVKEIVESSSFIIEQIIFKNIIAEKNKDITDNIQYAKYIQDAIMPGESVLKATLPDSFLYFMQKDILGGDFYWFDVIGELTYIAVGDCTGHGVSGSLLSILASNFIRQAVLELQMVDPASILEYLNAHLQATLNQYNKGKQIIDGLDITLAILHHQQNCLYFSSAMHTAYLVRDNELIELKGNRKPIGGGYDIKGLHFSTHIISLYKGDNIYMTTDGYIDQFQMSTGKKFSRNRFKQMLLTICDLPMEEQRKKMLEAHTKWRGHEAQTDDICLVGFRY